MPKLLNYTTEIPANRSAQEITDRLRDHGAVAVLLEYDGAKELSGVSFRIETPHGVMPFRLPVDIPRTEQALRGMVAKKEAPKATMRPGQARRVAWRVLKDWIESQLAMIQVDMVTLDQVFLPYTVMTDQRSLYDTMLDGGFTKLLGDGAPL